MQKRSSPRTWRFERYVLTGTISQLGSRVRLTLTLTENATGAVVWSDRLRQEPFDALFDGFDYLASRIARGSQTERQSVGKRIGVYRRERRRGEAKQT